MGLNAIIEAKETLEKYKVSFSESGKGTIDKKSSGETKGRNGSSSRNYDVLGRELLTPDEARKLDNKKCLIFIRGFDPIIDNKFIPFVHPAFNQTADGMGESYVHMAKKKDNLIGLSFEILSTKALTYFEKRKEKGENVYIDHLTYDELKLIGEAEMAKRFTSMDEQIQKEKLRREQDNELEFSENVPVQKVKKEQVPVRKPLEGEDTITNRMLQWKYSNEQKEELKLSLVAKIPKEKILEFYYPETSVERMREIRKSFEM